MNTLEKLAWLQANTVSVNIETNVHRIYYTPIAQYLDEQLDGDDIETEVKAAILRRDEIVEARCYPHTPIGFHHVIHHDLQMAIDILYDSVREALTPVLSQRIMEPT
jgi:hypothetical protein